MLCCFFFFKQKTAYEMRISDWSSDVCSSDLRAAAVGANGVGNRGLLRRRQIEITEIIAAELQPLAAVGEVGDQRRGALVGTGLLQAVEDDAFHSTRSTKTFTVPPQEIGRAHV